MNSPYFHLDPPFRIQRPPEYSRIDGRARLVDDNEQPITEWLAAEDAQRIYEAIYAIDPAGTHAEPNSDEVALVLDEFLRFAPNGPRGFIRRLVRDHFASNRSGD